MTMRLSIVVAVQGSAEGLDTLLDVVLEQMQPDIELLVCAGRDWDRASVSCANHAGVRLLRAESRALTPHLWRDGILAARGKRVAITIAQHVPALDWVERLLAADLHNYVAVGGALAIERSASGGSWAAYLLRYAAYSPGGACREVADVPGDNAVYDREALLAHRSAFADGFWEPEIHARLRDEGRRLLFDPALVVTQRAELQAREFARQRLAHGTRFGFDRAVRLSGSMRLAYAVAAPAAPLILGFKVILRAWRRPELRRHLPRALPLLAVFVLAWGLGEARGALSALRAGSRA